MSQHPVAKAISYFVAVLSMKQRTTFAIQRKKATNWSAKTFLLNSI
jgi:hypothetical protein